MRNAKRETLVAVMLAAWCVNFCCPAGAAQDWHDPASVTSGDFSYLPAVGWGEDVVSVQTPASPQESAPVELNWTQRIVRLARGRTQLEGGYSYLRGIAGGDGTQHAFPDLLLRVGVTDRLELRVGWPGYVSGDSGNPAVDDGSGFLDPNVGLLYDLWPQRGALPQTAILAAVPINMGGNPFALDSLQPLTEVLYAWQTSDLTWVTGRSGLALFDAAGDDYTQFQQSLSFDLAINQRLGAFATWDMLSDHGSSNDTTQHMIGGGLSYLLTEQLAVSWRSAFGVNSAAPDFLNDIRFAYRF